jgi:hypothetical protein
MKRKIIALLVVVLALVSTVGVGFAAWVVSKPVTAEKTGSINVDVVSEDGLKLTLSWKDSVEELNLLGPTTQNIEGQWLTYDGADHENKSVTLVIHTENSDGSKLFHGTLHVDLSDVEAKLEALKGSDYITYTFKQNGTALTKVGGTGDHKDWYEVATDASGDAEFTIAFEWGTVFGEQNPYTYFNTNKEPDKAADNTHKQENETWSAYAYRTIGALQTAVDGWDSTDDNNSYEFTLTVYASASYGELVDATPAANPSNTD